MTSTSVRPALAALAALAIATLAGCSSEDDSPDGTPERSPSTGGTTGQAEQSAGPALVSADADDDGWRYCQARAGRGLKRLAFSAERPVRPLDGEPVGAGVRVTGGSVAPAPQRRVDDFAQWYAAAPPADLRDRLRWDEREPLAGAEIEAGDYSWFVAFDAPMPSALDAVRLRYVETDTGEEGVLDLPTHLRYSRSC